MRKLKDYKSLRDPVYGYIKIPMKYMSDIVDSAVFQRLRRIIQTSYSPLYSSAVHNRFVHSLGVYYLGTIAAKNVERELENITEMKKEDIHHLGEIFELACLLHDVGHAPFSHTGEKLYLSDDLKYNQIHKLLVDEVDTKSFTKDIEHYAGKCAAPHEIMSAIVGIRAFPNHIVKAGDKEFFARCITGYKYTESGCENSIKNCFVSLLNSNVIDVDKLDYLIRDAYITGFNTVRIDYIRLLNALTVKECDEEYQIAYYKDAISVIENVVYAHDAERKWIQNHPVVLYECYILNHVFLHLNEKLNTKKSRLFSYESLSEEGNVLNKGIRVSLLCDDDIIYIMKNVKECKTELSTEYFNRNKRRHPVFKSEAEYGAFISNALGGGEYMKAFEDAMKATAAYLMSTSDTWTIDDKTIEKLENELKILKDIDNCKYDEDTIKAQKENKEAALKLSKCLIEFADRNGLLHDFVIIEASQFSSGFAKSDFSKIPIIFNSSSDEIIETDFEKVARPLKAGAVDREKFYYLFYRRGDDNSEIDKAELCSFLASQFSAVHTKKKRKKIKKEESNA